MSSHKPVAKTDPQPTAPALPVTPSVLLKAEPQLTKEMVSASTISMGFSFSKAGICFSPLVDFPPDSDLLNRFALTPIRHTETESTISYSAEAASTVKKGYASVDIEASVKSWGITGKVSAHYDESRTQLSSSSELFITNRRVYKKVHLSLLKPTSLSLLPHLAKSLADIINNNESNLSKAQDIEAILASEGHAVIIGVDLGGCMANEVTEKRSSAKSAHELKVDAAASFSSTLTICASMDISGGLESLDEASKEAFKKAQSYLYLGGTHHLDIKGWEKSLEEEPYTWVAIGYRVRSTLDFLPADLRTKAKHILERAVLERRGEAAKVEAQPLYKMYRNDMQDHYYGLAIEQAFRVPGGGESVDEGVLCKVFVGPQVGTMPIWRAWSNEHTDNFYTLDRKELERLVREEKYIEQLLVGFAYPEAVPNETIPIYCVRRMFDGMNGKESDCLMTTNVDEYNNLKAEAGFVDYGILFHGIPNPDRF